MLTKLRELGRVEAELVAPISFPVRYVLTENKAGDLVILCYLQNRDYSFASWTNQSGLSATQFEPFSSLRINDCIDEIRQLCEKIHAAWSEGKGRDDCSWANTPTDAGVNSPESPEGT